ncbi:MAG: right-handed parallel beta-helix repeat-containing protein [Kiritimatiellaeota bacterium]|nr:right-handed parallel beta-helix repeat-containing protein [Kiritimatiellota bacterium]
MNMMRVSVWMAAVLAGGSAMAGVLHDFSFSAKEGGALKYGGAGLETIEGLNGKAAAVVDEHAFAAPKMGFVKEPFSLVIWVKPLALGSQKGNAGTTGGMLVANGNGYTEGFRVFATDWASRLPRFEIGRANGAFGINAKDSLSEGYWNCVVATWDREVMRLYVNGSLSAEGAFAGEVLPAREGFRIGFAGAGVGSFKQAFDKVQVYDHALSPEEVEALLVKTKTAEYTAWRKLRAAYGDRKSEIAACVEVMGKASHPDWLRGEATERLMQMCRNDAGGALPSGALEKITAPHRDTADADLRKKLALALGESYAREKKTKQAIAVYEKLLGESDTLDTRETYARLLWSAGQLAAAREQYAMIFKDEANGVSARALAGLAVGKIFMQEKRERDADAVFGAVADMEGVAPHIKAEAANLAEKKDHAPNSKQPWRDFPKTAIEFYVAPDGSDADDGSKAKPFATLARARDAVRAAPKDSGVTVFIRGGRYSVTDTLELTAEDSGAGGNARVVWRAYPSETPVFDGGFEVKGFERVTDPNILRRLPEEARGKVYVADARAQGYPSAEPQKIYGRADRYANNGGVREVFADGVPLPIARWPNEGWLKTGAQVGSVTNRAFAFSHERMKRWGEAKESMAAGYWFHLWADGVVPVAFGEDSISFRVRLPEEGLKADHPFYVLNLLEEIDRPGEWYYDCASGKLYAWLPSRSAKVVMSRWDKPFIRAKGVKNISISGLVYEYGQHDALVMEQGEGVAVVGCMFRRLGGSAFTAWGMKDLFVFGNSFNTLGHTGMRVKGGDRKALTSGGIVIENNEVFDFARFGRTYNPALHLEGCGARVAYNHFHHGPSSAVRIEGNDHVFEYNRVNNVVTESDDQGGIDMWCDPSYRGNVIRYNYWKDINSGNNDPCGQAAIRFDDAISGSLVYGNYFENTSNGIFGGVQIHGGQFNILDNNVFINCKIGVSWSAWGERRFRQFLEEPRIKGLMAAADIDGELYRERYPELPVAPEQADRNSVWRNLFVTCGQVYFRTPRNTDAHANQVHAAPPDYADIAKHSTFRPLPPPGAMGPYENPFRITNGKVK